jgi:outer membrane translocation and assembly module TamA
MPIDTDNKEEEEVLKTHPASHKDEVKKLKRTIKEMKKQYNNLLDATKYNSNKAKVKIKALNEKIENITNIAETLGKDAKNSRRLYKEHIEYIAALIATGKDPEEILKPRQPDSYNGDSDKL